MNLYEILKAIGFPVAYGRFKTAPTPPYLIYVGNGQNTFQADDTVYFKQNNYQVEFYFKNKNEETENKIEKALTESGYIYEKSEDVYLESEDLFMIYYTI